MHRDGEIVYFDPVDASRAPGMGLREWVPIEAVPELLGQLAARQALAKEALDAANDLPPTAHYAQHDKAAALRKLHDLGVLEKQFSIHTPDEYAAVKMDAIFDGLGLSLLHEE